MKLIAIIVLGLASFVPPVASAHTVKGTLCELIRLDPPLPSENFTEDSVNTRGTLTSTASAGNFLSLQPIRTKPTDGRTLRTSSALSLRVNMH